MGCFVHRLQSHLTNPFSPYQGDARLGLSGKQTDDVDRKRPGDSMGKGSFSSSYSYGQGERSEAQRMSKGETH